MPVGKKGDEMPRLRAVCNGRGVVSSGVCRRNAPPTVQRRCEMKNQLCARLFVEVVYSAARLDAFGFAATSPSAVNF